MDVCVLMCLYGVHVIVNFMSVLQLAFMYGRLI